MLAMSAAFAFVVYLMRFDKGLAVQITWLLFTAGFAFLALDEQAKLHERLGGEIEPILRAARFGLPDTNDLIVIGYGILAVPVFLMALPELARWPGVIRLFLIALPFYVAHTALDSIDIGAKPLVVHRRGNSKIYLRGVSVRCDAEAGIRGYQRLR